MRFNWQRELGGNTNSLPTLVLLLSLSATVCAWIWAGYIVRGSDQERFNYAVEETTDAIQGRIDDQLDLVRAVGATFTLRRRWPHSRFHKYIDNLDFSQHYSGLVGIGFIEATKSDKVAELEKYTKQDGLPNFRVKSENQSKVKFPVVYWESEEPASFRLVGKDQGDDPVKAVAMTEACDSGGPSVSTQEPLGYSIGRVRSPNGLTIFQPVYDGGEVPDTVQERRSKLIGFVFVPMRGPVVFRNILEGQARRFLDVRILDRSPDGTVSQIYSSARGKLERVPAMSQENVLPILGREWILVLHSSTVFEQESATWLVTWILLAGTLISLLLALVSYTQGRANRLLSSQTDELARRQSEVTRLNENLEMLVQERTTELRASNAELQAFCYSVSHDLRAPLRSVDGFSQSLLEDYGEQLDDQAKDYLKRVRNASKRMDELITALLNLSRITRLEIVRVPIDLSQLAIDVFRDVADSQQRGLIEFRVQEGMEVEAEPKLVRVLLDNLLANAVKFSSGVEHPSIEVGVDDNTFFVRDNGVGFNPAYYEKLFVAFERLHSPNEYPGTGIGLATVHRIVQRHGGQIWAESAPNQGATFYFTLR